MIPKFNQFLFASQGNQATEFERIHPGIFEIPHEPENSDGQPKHIIDPLSGRPLRKENKFAAPIFPVSTHKFTEEDMQTCSHIQD